MTREELARLLFSFSKRGQSARRCDNLAEFESRLFAELIHLKKLLSLVLFFCFLATDPRWAGQTGEEQGFRN